MAGYVNDAGVYYEGDRQGNDIEYPTRPSPYHLPKDGEWVLGPVPAKVMTSLSFIELFTKVEQLAVLTAAMQSAELRLWYDKLMAADEVAFDDPRLLEGMGVIVSAGLITQARRDEILG